MFSTFCLHVAESHDVHGQLVMVTEAIFGSIYNVLHHFEGVPNASKGTKELELSELEIKHGLLQVMYTSQPHSPQGNLQLHSLAS